MSHSPINNAKRNTTQQDLFADEIEMRLTTSNWSTSLFAMIPLVFYIECNKTARGGSEVASFHHTIFTGRSVRLSLSLSLMGPSGTLANRVTYPISRHFFTDDDAAP